MVGIGLIQAHFFSCDCCKDQADIWGFFLFPKDCAAIILLLNLLLKDAQIRV